MEAHTTTRFICSRTCGAMDILTPDGRQTLVQALVFAQIGADQRHKQKPTTSWQHFQGVILRDMEWIVQRQAFLVQQDEQELLGAELMAGFADEQLSTAQATLIRELLVAITALPTLPAPLRAERTSALSAALVTSSSHAIVLTLAWVNEDDGRPEGELSLPCAHLSCTEYRWGAGFWQLKDQLQSSVGEYARRYLKDLDQAGEGQGRPITYLGRS